MADKFDINKPDTWPERFKPKDNWDDLLLREGGPSFYLEYKSLGMSTPGDNERLPPNKFLNTLPSIIKDWKFIRWQSFIVARR